MAFYVRGLKLGFTLIVLSALLFEEINGAPAPAPSTQAHAPTSHGVGIKENRNGYAFVLVGLISALFVQAIQ